MTNEEKAIALGAFAVIVVVAGLFMLARRSGKIMPRDVPLPPVEIAKIVDPRTAGGAGVGGIFLLIFSAYCIFKYLSAETFNEQIVALLLWIGNGVFWGSLTIAAVISGGRTSVVYRDQVPAPRQEPQL